jgi:tetratricopeptide (TPR) repeat protein
MLCRQLIQRIEADLFDGDGYRASFVFQSNDPWTNQAFARAMEAFQLKNGESALKLIRVVVELEPDNPAVRYGLLEILCQLGRPESLALGETLLQAAIDAGDTAVAADVHRLLAMATWHIHGETPAAHRHSQESIRLAGPINASYRVQHIYNEAASAALRRGDHDEARALHLQVELASERTGNALQGLIASSSRGAIEASLGNLATARDLLETCLPKFESIKLRSRLMLARSNLAHLCLAMGLPQASRQHADALVALLPSSQIRWFNLQCLAMVSISYGEMRQLEKIEHALKISGVLIEDLAGGELCHALVADAQRDVCRRDFDAACNKLRGTIDLVVERNDGEAAAQWAPELLINEMRAERYAHAEATAAGLLEIATMKASPDIAGMRLHARALILHAEGDSAGARACLGEALALMQPGRWSVLVRLDAAWLDIERGDLEAAKRVLVGTFSWLQSHPTGQFVEARLQFALGHHDKALTAFQRSGDFVQPDAAFAARALECYGHRGTGDPPQLPPMRRLPSVM